MNQVSAVSLAMFALLAGSNNLLAQEPKPDVLAARALIDVLRTEAKNVNEGIKEALFIAIYESLVKIGEPAVADVSRLLIDKEDEVIRRAAARILGEIGPAARTGETVEALVSTLETDKDAIARQLAAEALGKISAKEAFQPLIDTLRNEKEELDVRHAAAWALGKMFAWPKP